MNTVIAAWTRRPNARNSAVALSIAGLLTTVGAALPASATTQGSYSLEVLVDGRPLTELAGRGRAYVEAIAGREYSLRVSNHSGRRVAVAVAVDGLNSIDAKTTSAGEGAKWIVGPYETITLDGWQTSSNLARRFYFTTETASYGAWLGQTQNLGIISAVVYRERLPEPIFLPRRQAGAAAPRASSSPGSAAGEPSQPPSLEAAGVESKLSDDYAATGIGREVDHRVERVAFAAEAVAAATLELRYEYRDALVRLGVLPRSRPCCDSPLDRRERARGFDDTGFAPDPYRRQRRH
jgi:hypothetical protein